MILTGLGGGSPGGADTQIQFNNAGVFGGSPNLTWDGSTLSAGTPESGLDALLQGYVTPSSVIVSGLNTGGSALGILTQDSTLGVRGIFNVGLANAAGTVNYGFATDLYAGADVSALVGYTVYLEVLPGRSVTKAYGYYMDFPVELGAGSSLVESSVLWAGDQAGASTNPYYIWLDSRGVARWREDALDGAGNGQAIGVVYNPRHPKYTAGAVDFERGVYGQWLANVYQIGTEVGDGSAGGVLRGVRVIGASLTVPASLTVGAHLVTLTGALTRVGAHALTLTTTGTTSLTLPTTGTLATTGDLSQFAATTSLQLKGVISDETGSGALVFATAPTLTGPMTLTGVVGSSALTITGATQTSNFPALDITQTWNNSGITFYGVRVNITTGASAAGSLVCDFQSDSVSRLQVDKSGNGIVQNTWRVGTLFAVSYYEAGIQMTGALAIGTTTAGRDTYLVRGAAAVFQMGKDVNGAAIAQTFKAHDGITGTDIAGANLTLAGGRGTGTGAPGNLIFQTAVQVASGTTAQTLATRFQIIENKIALFGVTPVVQPATGGAASTFVANTSLIADDTATFDGYTIGQVVKALRNLGALA